VRAFEKLQKQMKNALNDRRPVVVEASQG